MTKRIDLVGRRFGRLTVIKYSNTNKKGIARWNCQCDCGKKTNSSSGNLLSGGSKSCGCGKATLKMGNKNPMWKENVSYSGLHYWVRSNLIGERKCECGSVKNIDVANLSGQYKRDLSDWKWQCRKCHMNEDERILNLKQYNKK